MVDQLLTQIQEICISAAAAAVTALCIYLFTWLRSFLGIKESDSNEASIRAAAKTAAGILVKQDAGLSPEKVAEAASKIIADLPTQIRDEHYNMGDVKEMIVGAAATIFPPAGLLKLLK